MIRPVLHGDVSSAARALLAVPAADRPAFCQQMLRGARLAGAWLRATGRVHPQWGNGTLMAAARRFPLAPEPGFDNPAYRACFAMVLEHIPID